MELDVLKVYAGSFVSELDIDKEDKLALIGFLKEADEYDIMALLTDGDLPDEWTDDYLASLDESMEILESEVTAMENILEDVMAAQEGKMGDVWQKAKDKAFDTQVAARGLKKRMTRKGVGKHVAAHKGKYAAGAAGLGALSAAAALRARKKRKAAEAAAAAK